MICTNFEHVHLLNNTWISEFWYGFIVLIGLVVSIIFYVHHQKKNFRISLFVLLVLCLFSFGMHQTGKPKFENPIELSKFAKSNDDNFQSSPNFLGNALGKFVDFVRRKFLYADI